MPAKSAAQHTAAGATLSAARGATAKSKLKEASKSMVVTMAGTELDPAHRPRRKPEQITHGGAFLRRPRTKPHHPPQSF